MKAVVASLIFLLLLTGCGGGGANSSPGSSTTPPPPPMPVQSPGGHWLAFDSSGNQVQLFISEAGNVRAIFDVPAVTAGPTFGTGSVTITGTDSVSGVLQAKGLQPSPGSPAPADLTCNLSGSVLERQTLTLEVECSDNIGIVLDESLAMFPESGYNAGSSLDAIAGNYTLSFRPNTNMLNIINDGTLFGMYHNGANCIVNGTVSVIDENYSFLDVRWTMANCTDPFGIYEGAEMTGFAMPSSFSSVPQGGYYFLLTGMTSDGLRSISVVFEPT